MKNLGKMMVAVFAVLISYTFFYWIYFMVVPYSNSFTWLANIIAFCLSISIGLFMYRKMGRNDNRVLTYALKGAVLLGAIGFSIGFFGPIIFTPSSNQGPLLGIFITGPIGFLLGLIAGALYGKFKVSVR
jgi:hypothetical protein